MAKTLTIRIGLERYGLVRMRQAIGKRRGKTPQAGFGEIAVRIAI